MTDDADLQHTRLGHTEYLSRNDDATAGNVVRINSRTTPPGRTPPNTTTSTSASKARHNQHEMVSFNRKELDQILRVYGFKVADGEWKDYSIDMLKDRAVFSVYRRAHDLPLHCIEKIPRLAARQGAYAVTGSDGRILKRGHNLPAVLKVLERKRPKLSVV